MDSLTLLGLLADPKTTIHAMTKTKKLLDFLLKQDFLICQTVRQKERIFEY